MRSRGMNTAAAAESSGADSTGPGPHTSHRVQVMMNRRRVSDAEARGLEQETVAALVLALELASEQGQEWVLEKE